MTWLAFRVEIHTSDERDGTSDRIQREMLRALEHRFGAVVIEVEELPIPPLHEPWIPKAPWKVEA